MPTEKIQDSLQTSKQEKTTLSSFQLIEKNLPRILPQNSPEELQTLLKIIKEKLPKGSNQQHFLINLKSVGEKDFETIKKKLLYLIEQEQQNFSEKEDISNNQPALQGFRATSQDTQNTSQDTQNTSQDTEDIKEQNRKNLIQTSSWEQIDKKDMQAIKDNIEQTKRLQQLLNPKYTSHTEAQLKAKTESLSPQVKKKLQESHISTLDYASFLLSREKIGDDTFSPENQVFLKSLKNLEKNLGIPETYAGGFFKSFGPQAETFTQNPDLAQYAKENQDFSTFDQLDYFPENSTFEEDQNLIQKFGSPKLQEFSQKIQPLLKKAKEQLTDDEKTIFINYEQQIKQLKSQLETKAKNFMKASITNAPINAILKYLDSESLGNQTLSDLLKKPKGGSFAQIHQEGKDQVLHFQGTIDGNPLTFYYNLSDPNATLECDDCLYYDSISKTLSLNKGSGTRTKLNIQMPTTEQLASNLNTTCSPKKFQEILEHSSNPKEYQQQFSQLVSGTLENSFSNEKLIKSRLARHTEKNLTIQDFESTFIPPEITHQLTSGGKLNEDPATKQLFKLLDRSSEQSTSMELQNFRRSLKKREAMINTPEKIEQIQDPILRACLEKCADAKLKKSDFQTWNKAMLNFFNLFTRQTVGEAETNTDDPNYILNFNDFNRFVAYLEKPEKHITDDQQLQNFSPIFQEKYEKQNTNIQENDDLTSLEEQIKESFEVAYT